jgi:Zn-dependent peptidase ImmA (M78 family)
MAHSLAHWMLHSDELHYYDRNFIAEEPIDTQANTYAAALLMPEWMIRVIGREIVSYAPSKLAPYFNVSDVAMNYRLKKLGIL